MSDGLFIRSVNGLTPADDSAREMMAGLPIGKMVKASVSRPRNLGHHRLYWSLCSAIASSIGAQRENVSDVIKIRTGHVTIVQTKSERYRLPKSISFAKMDQSQFNEFFKECCRVVTEEFLPHMKPGDLVKEIEQMVGLETAA